MNSIGEIFDNSNQLIDGIHLFFDRYIGNSLLRKSGIHKIVDKIMSKGYEYPDSPLLRLLGKNLKEVLRKNPKTAYVSDSIIKFTQEFKVKLVEAVNQGVPVRRFIQEAGYEYEMLGDDRVKTFV